MPSHTSDVLIIGGGVIGLSLAYELSGRGVRVCLLDRQELGREASWAGAGIIPFGSWYSTHPAVESLAACSRQLFPLWSEALRHETGIDNGWWVCGALYLGGDLLGDQLQQAASRFACWHSEGAYCQQIGHIELSDLEPRIADSDLTRDWNDPVGYYLPQEAQLRNPRHLKALVEACSNRGVELHRRAHVREFTLEGDTIDQVHTDAGSFSAGEICLTAGCWTGQVAEALGLDCALKPLRGQMVLLKHEPGELGLRHIVHLDGRYAVPRDDGLLLIGATVEDVGFVKTTTASGVSSLLRSAESLGLGPAEVVRSWAGLRPATPDGLPYLGRLPNFRNGWIAAGHSRAGLQLSPGTAMVMSSLLRGEEPSFDVAALSVERLPAKVT